MQYDKVKRTLGDLCNENPFLRKCFYRLLNILLLRAWYINRELRRLKKQLPADAVVLDAGSGFGQYDYYMSRIATGWSIKAIDIKAEQVSDCNRFFERIGRNKQVHFEEADLTTFIEPDKYHLSLSVDVMEHIEDDVLVFKNIYASLRPGGVLLVSTPSDQGGSDAHDEHDESFIDEHVRNGYGIEEIRQKMTNAGFSQVDARYTYGLPGHISWLLSMKYPLSMLNVSKLFFILLPFYYLITFPFSLILNWLDVSTNHKTGTGLKVKAIK